MNKICCVKKWCITPLFLLFAILFIALFGTKAETRTQLKIGTFVKVTLRGPRWLDFDSAFKKAFSAVDRTGAAADVHNKGSELSRLNRNAHIEPVVVSRELFDLISESVLLSKMQIM